MYHSHVRIIFGDITDGKGVVMVPIKVPAKVSSRLKSSLKKFQPILKRAIDRDVNESDTVAIVTDILAEVFGYDKYHEVTSEHEIRGTYCDLAVEIDGKLQLLTEVKAIGLDLKEKHLRQAANYAANQGCKWVALTNGVSWQVYRMDFGQEIREELFIDLNLLEMNPNSSKDIGSLYPLTREGIVKSALEECFDQKQATSRFVLGALIVSDPVIKVIRRELRKISPGLKVNEDKLKEVIEREVLKREITESEKAAEAKKKVGRALAKAAKAKAKPVTPVTEAVELPASDMEET